MGEGGKSFPVAEVITSCVRPSELFQGPLNESQCCSMLWVNIFVGELCAEFLFNARIVRQSIRGGVEKHCGCIDLVYSKCTCTCSCHVVFFCCFKVSGCVSSCQTYGLFLLLIFRHAHSKETPLNTAGRVCCFVASS